MAAYVVFKTCEYRLAHDLAEAEPARDDAADAKTVEKQPD